MSFEKGSLIYIEYTASLQSDGRVIETTNETTAQAHSIYDNETSYGQKLVSLGELNYPVLDALKNELLTMSVGEQRLVEIPPERAWGARDPKKIRIYSIRKLGKDAEKYSVGDKVEIENKTGIIRFMSSGRVQVDFNHEYAGKTLIYDVIVKGHLETDEDKIDAIIDARIKSDDVEYTILDNSLSISLFNSALTLSDVQAAKRLVVRDMFKFVPNTNHVEFIETYPNPSKPREQESVGSANFPAPSLDDDDDGEYEDIGDDEEFDDDDIANMDDDDDSDTKTSDTNKN